MSIIQTSAMPINSNVSSSLQSISPGPRSRFLSISLNQQDYRNWCWAAVAQGVADFYNIKHTNKNQCYFANLILKKSICCYNGNSRFCNVTQKLDHVLNVIGHLGPLKAGAVSPIEAMTEIDSDRLICIQKTWDGGAFSHFLLVSGFISDASFLAIQDPTSPIGTHKAYMLNSLVGNINSVNMISGLWEVTFFTVKK